MPATPTARIIDPSITLSPLPGAGQLNPPDGSHVDVLIIGSGAGGGTLARHLAGSGLKVLVLERGDWLPQEPQNWSAEAVFQQGRYVSADTWHDKHGKAFQPGSHYMVGGATKMYGAAHFRLREADFGELIHHDGISPAWPLPYDVFEPYYQRAEELFHVHAQQGEDPTEPRRSAPYPHPPIAHEPRMQKLVDDLRAAGLRPFHAPSGVMLDEANLPFSRCRKCNRCDGFPCLVHAKGDADVVGIRPALADANVSLLTRAHVQRLLTDASGGRVTAVEVLRDGEPMRFSADVVVVSCGAANSARLLLMSANDRHPAGLANGSGQVGRNYMFHNSKALVALAHEPNTTVFQKTVSINDWYLGSEAFPYPMGNIQMTGKTSGTIMKGYAPLETFLMPGWSMDQIAEHALDFWLSSEDLPDPENRITVNKEGAITLSYTPNNQTASAKLEHNLRGLLDSLYLKNHLVERQIYVKSSMAIAAVGHQAGTCRFGTDPTSSVLDLDCKAHELDNLYVVDTSFFPSIGAVNPSLTAIANALRVGDHLIARLQG
ncbi:MAG: dehydrogenase [Cyanobium sp.]|uniref:GMC family oxidoreductase n=1 Tax=Synechococcus sp. CS-1333 TaxID=2848638 RepID=UPI000DBBDD9F|nr:GMC family oxidoreductase [Synechococcus sp. CS-1333]MCT0211543.1 GMC family oxidoreductase [Synechococcus sp. CS-1333]PZV24625.1 MAG: dehydrogenase [Cyanobium sp.]